MNRLNTRRHTRRFSAAFAVVFQLVPAPCPAVSFDCAKAQTFREKAVCSNSDLGDLDDLLSATYQEAASTSADRQGLVVSQRKWIADTNRCADDACIATAYRSRISELDDGSDGGIDSTEPSSSRISESLEESGPIIASSRTRIVEVSGVGDSLVAAKEDAVRQAVESVVSSYVSSDLVQKNDAIITDKVINYSAGFVEKINVLSQGKRPDGLYEVRVKAAVTTEKLRRKLEEQNIETRELEPDSMFGEAASKLNSVNSVYDLWSGLFKKFPAAALAVKVVGKPQLEPSFHGDANVIVKFTVKVGWDEGYVVEFRNLLSKTTSPGRQGDFGSCAGFRVDNVCHSFMEAAAAKKVFLAVYQHITPIRVIAAIKSADGSIVRKLASKCIGRPGSASYVQNPAMDGHPREEFPANPFVYASVADSGTGQANYDFVFLLDPEGTDDHVRNHTIVFMMYSDTVDETFYKPVGEFALNMASEVGKDDVLNFNTIEAYAEACQFDQPDYSNPTRRLP